jgi:hypothetical protein
MAESDELVAMSYRKVTGLELKMRTPVAAMRLRSSLWKRLQGNTEETRSSDLLHGCAITWRRFT